jgi:membrane protease YdiL (CAAX protease family)
MIDGVVERSADPFEAYRELARNGRDGPFRILLGALTVAAVALAGTFLLVGAGVAIQKLGWLPALFPPASDGMGNPVLSFMDSRAGTALMVLSLGALWPGVWLALRLIHRRPFASVLGADGRLSGIDFVKGLAATALAGIPVMTAALLFDPTLLRNDIAFGVWLAALPVLLLFVLVQTSAEEVAFRGYLMQALAGRYRSPLVLAVIPAFLFTLGHFDGRAIPTLNMLNLSLIGLFAAMATYLVWRTGNLAAAIGLHFGNNVIGLLVVSPADFGRPISLFTSRGASDPGWTALEMFFLAGTQLVFFAMVLALLLHSASRLRLAGRQD